MQRYRRWSSSRQKESTYVVNKLKSSQRSKTGVHDEEIGSGQRVIMGTVGDSLFFLF